MKHIEEALRIAQEANQVLAREADKVVVLRSAAEAAQALKARAADARQAPTGRAADAPESARTRAGATSPVARAGATAAAQAHVRRLRLEDLSSLVYTHTRRVDVKPETLERSRIIDTTDQSAVTRAYKLLRTQVLHRMDREGWRTLAVLSPSAREGKTLTAINLSATIASSAQRTVLLVDCDWRKPSVHTYFGFTPQHDIVSYLRGGASASLSQSLFNPGIPRLCLLPCRAPVEGSSERLASTGVAALVAELKARYANRTVIFDLPPMLLTDDALSFLPHVDCVLLVVEDNKTDRTEITRVLRMIPRERLVGTVLNKSSTALAEY